ncbi:hypothetical protein PSY81_23480, partial [Shigella flexneri]|nr:hypothetical protein [Shigella flexneri]
LSSFSVNPHNSAYYILEPMFIYFKILQQIKEFKRQESNNLNLKDLLVDWGLEDTHVLMQRQ